MKINIKKSQSTFQNVTLREPTVGDLIAAERVAGDNKSNQFALALLAQIGTFDGKKCVMEELQSLSITDFLAMSKELISGELPDLAAPLSSSAESLASASPKSKP